MIIVPVEAGPIATKGYLVYDREVGDGIIIDVPLFSLTDFMEIIGKESLNIRYILLTHSHWDHIGDAAKLGRALGAKIAIHKADEQRLLDPAGQMSAFRLPFEIEAVKPDLYLNDKEKIELDNIEFEVMHTPGHTEGGVCLVSWKDGCVFSGDTLFKGSIGRYDLAGGDYDQLIGSVKNKLMALPDDFKVYCGHGPDTTIGEERKSNPFCN